MEFNVKDHNNRKLYEDTITKELLNNNSILIQSPMGIGRESSAKDAAKNASFNVVTFDMENFSRPFNNVKIEDTILNSLDKIKSNVILLTISLGKNIDIFVDIAKKKNIPIIFSLSETFNYSDSITLTKLSTVDSIYSVLNNPKSTLDTDKEVVLQKIKTLQDKSINNPKDALIHMKKN